MSERVSGIVNRVNGVEVHVNAVDEAKNLNTAEVARLRAELEALEKRETAWQQDLYHEQTRLDNLESLLRPLDGLKR
jgi:chromosome segregation ATPase